MKSRHSHPLVIELDKVFETFTLILQSFAEDNGFELERSKDGDFNPPFRTLKKSDYQLRYFQIFDFRVTGRDSKTNQPPAPSEKLPMRLTVFTTAFCFDKKAWKHHRHRVFDNLPLEDVRKQLDDALIEGLQKLEEWPRERILSEGET